MLSHDQKIEQLRVKRLFDGLEGPVLASSLVALAVFYGVDAKNPIMGQIWIAFQFILIALRLVFIRWAKYKFENTNKLSTYIAIEKGYAALIFLLGLSWVWAIDIFQTSKPIESQILIVCYLGIMFGALTTLASSKICSYPYAVICIFGYCIITVIQNENTSWIMAVVGILFVLVTLRGIASINKLLKQSVNLSVERENYIQELEEKVELEKRLKKQELANANQSLMAEIGHMAGGIAHEINNPLAIISMSAEQLNKSNSVIEDDFAVKKVHTIQKTVKRINSIVKSLLKLSRGKNDGESEFTNTSELLSDVINITQSRVKSCGINLSIEDNLIDSEVSGNITDLSQILLNLLNNAIDEVNEQSEPWIKIVSHDGPDFIEIRISDSGKGIPDEVRSKLFKPFYTTKPIGKGTGLGLSLSKALIESNQGQLYLENDSPTTFVLKLLKRSAQKDRNLAS